MKIILVCWFLLIATTSFGAINPNHLNFNINEIKIASSIYEEDITEPPDFGLYMEPSSYKYKAETNIYDLVFVILFFSAYLFVTIRQSF
jgi:hypothetical protein